MSMKKKETIIFFANTLWFFEKFKYDLILFLSYQYNIKCIYIREGPSLDKNKIKELKDNKNIDLISLKKFVLRNLFIRFNEKQFKIKLIIVHTLECIFLSFLFPHKYKKLIIYVFEGLGRVFSSRLIIYRLIKRIVIKLYSYLFNICKLVILLNSSDAAYFAELGIIPIRKMRIIPGTGINTDLLDEKIIKNKITPKYIDFIGRMIPEKGYISFIYMRLNLIEYFPELAEKYEFRIITPTEYINSLDEKDLNYLKNIGIEIRPYFSDSFKYYKETKLIILASRYGEGISRVALEAAYIGIPILASKNKGIEDLFPNNYKYFINSFNPFKMTIQLAEMLNDREYFNNINKDLREFIKTNFSNKKAIDKITKYIFEVF